MVRNPNLKGYLFALARSYGAVNEGQQCEDFWGLREFYSMVRKIQRGLERRGTMLTAQVLMDALLRNFGGRPQELEAIIETFFSSMGLEPTEATRLSRVSCVRQNLSEPEARHLMLLTRNNAALPILLHCGILPEERAEVIIGSDFASDQNDLQVGVNLQRLKFCMAEGITVVLVHCEMLFESLYDLLNQHYTEYGGQQFVRLA